MNASRAGLGLRTCPDVNARVPTSKHVSRRQNTCPDVISNASKTTATQLNFRQGASRLVSVPIRRDDSRRDVTSWSHRGHIVADVYGSSAMKRARLIACATCSCSCAESPVRLRE